MVFLICSRLYQLEMCILIIPERWEMCKHLWENSYCNPRMTSYRNIFAYIFSFFKTRFFTWKRSFLVFFSLHKYIRFHHFYTHMWIDIFLRFHFIHVLKNKDFFLHRFCHFCKKKFRFKLSSENLFCDDDRKYILNRFQWGSSLLSQYANALKGTFYDSMHVILITIDLK